MMIAMWSLILLLLLSGSAPPQGTKREDIVAHLSKDGPTKGSNKAPVTLVEFSDFQCSFCRKFWEYHDKLFASAGSAFAFTDGRLKGYAEELGLKSRAFDQCFASGKYLKKVEGETAMAAFFGARGTPAFFLNGQLLVGAQPFEVFEAAIEKELKITSSSGKAKP